ncbi:MAG TPA: response regulator [Candidatus Deferrimicrobiaceae bacterium]|nr:response regulator [Candidatus Deferrimicrobiaceae bacterium]
MSREKILIVADRPPLLEGLSELLKEKGCDPRGIRTAEEGLGLLGREMFSLALVDVSANGGDGFPLASNFKRISPDTEVVFLAENGSRESVSPGVRDIVYEYLPISAANLDAVWETVRRALEKRALSLKNRQLDQDLDRRNRELSASLKRQNSLIRAGIAMGGISTLPELLDFFVGLVSEELDVERVSLMLVNDRHGEIRIAASRGLDAEVVEKVRLKVGEGIAGWVAKEGKPVLVKDVMTDPRISRSLGSTNAGSFISAPMVFSIPIQLQEKVLGVINVTDRRSGLPFDEEDMAFLYGLAGQAAMAIERTRQFEELQGAYESLKAAQKDIVDTERLRALGQLAAGVAHDFNNLLHGILGRTQLLGMKLSNPELDLPFFRMHLGTIEKLTLQGAETISRIQDLSRIRKDVPGGPLDLNAVVKNAVEMTRTKWKDECEAKGIRIAVRVTPGTLPLTVGEPAEICRVVCNLIINSVEAMPGGGEISLATFHEGDHLQLEVADTGIGMRKEVQERLFEPFFTTKEAGQGLGTSIIYGIVARHGGEIRVNSVEGAGTTFRLRLPVLSPATWEKARKGREERQETDPARILIIEDGELNRELFERYVTEMGHKAVLASSGTEGLRIFEREKFDLVITDLSMPGISGLQVAEQVKNQAPDVPVLLVSGWAVHQEEQRIRQAGVDYILRKPCAVKDFQEVVAEALCSCGKDAPPNAESS